MDTDLTVMTKDKDRKAGKGKRNSQAKEPRDKNNVVDLFTKEVVPVKKVRKDQKNVRLFRKMFDDFLREEGHVLQDCIILFSSTNKDSGLIYSVFEDESRYADHPTLMMFKSYFDMWLKDRVWGTDDRDD